MTSTPAIRKPAWTSTPTWARVPAGPTLGRQYLPVYLARRSSVPPAERTESSLAPPEAPPINLVSTASLLSPELRSVLARTRAPTVPPTATPSSPTSSPKTRLRSSATTRYRPCWRSASRTDCSSRPLTPGASRWIGHPAFEETLNPFNFKSQPGALPVQLCAAFRDQLRVGPSRAQVQRHCGQASR